MAYRRSCLKSFVSNQSFLYRNRPSFGPCSVRCYHQKYHGRESFSAVVSIGGQTRQFGLKPSPVPPIHETPHYMDYDTLVDMHLVTRQGFGDRPLFGTKGSSGYKWLTYRDFGKKVDECRAAMASLGVRRGDVVSIISSNREEWAVCAYATYSLGAIFVPMYESQRPQDWRFIVEDAGAKLLFVANETIYQHTFHLAGVLGSLQGVYCFDAVSPSAPHSFQKLIHEHHTPVPAFLPDPKDIATYIYTSGTTGKPKGVMLSHANIISNITGLRDVLPEDLISCFDCSLSFLPWAHCYGQTAELHAFMAHGAALGIAQGAGEQLLDNMAEVKPTVLFAVPLLFKKIYDGIHAKVHDSSPIAQYLFKEAVRMSHHKRMHDEQGQSVGAYANMKVKLLDKLVLSKVRDRFGGRLKVAFVGGAATPMEVLVFFENIGLKLCEGYGLTETSPLVTINTTETKHRKLGSTGRCLGGVQVKICDAEGNEVPHDAEGEVCVSGPNVMTGYKNDPVATKEVLIDIGGKIFFRTGDIGRMESGKYLRITGRIKEQYKLENGKYVVPGPIEAALTSSKYITQALLYGDNKPFNVALLVPDWDLLANFAKSKTDLTAEQIKDKTALSSNTIIQHLIEGEVQKALDGTKKYELPRRWVLLREGFTKERGMLTPKMSVKRHEVIKTYKDLIGHIYSEHYTHSEPHAEELAAIDSTPRISTLQN